MSVAVKVAMGPLLVAAVLVMSPGLALAQDFTGEWTMSVGVGTTLMTLHCTLLQIGEDLDGRCAPADGTSGPLFRGAANGNHARWVDELTFRGQPSQVGFEADMTGSQAMKGVLTLSGKTSPFTATKD